LDPPEEGTPADKKPRATSESPQRFPYSPLVFDENRWGDYLERQNEYLASLGELGQGPPQRNIHVFADGGFFMMHTYFSRPNPAFIISGKPTPAIPPSRFEFDVDFAPVVNLLVINDDGWGVRGSWQQLDESLPIKRFPSNPKGKTTVSSVPVFGVPGFTAPGAKDMVNFSDHLRFTDWDVEIVKEFRWGPWMLITGGGVRYLYLSQTYDAFRVNSGTKNTDRVDSGRNFSGLGPSGILELRYQLGRLPIWLYGNTNGAVFFGRQETESFQRTVEKQPTTKTQELEAVTGASRTLSTADFEVGVDMAIPYGRVLLLIRAGLAEQIIFDGGNATAAAGNTDFFGLRFTAGVSY
jgi:hypothetical protein